MTKRTLTTLENLRIGDQFIFTKDPRYKWIKVNGEPIRKRRNVYSCWARPYWGIIPQPFQGKAEVIFLKKSKSIHL